MKLLYILIISLQCFVASVTAQVTLFAPAKMVAPNETFTVELRLTSADSMASLQFSFAWNAAVIAFQSLDTLGGFPPSAEANEFGTGNTATGKLTFLWIDRSNRGYKVPTDSFLVFKIIFKAIGANGTNSPLQFVATPTSIKASNADLRALTVTPRDGSIKVGTSAVFSQNTEGVFVGQNFPNPVDNQTVIPISLVEKEEVSLEITNITGEIFLMKKYQFQAGRHEIRLNTEGVLPSGLFIYNVWTKHGLVSRMMIKH